MLLCEFILVVLMFAIGFVDRKELTVPNWLIALVSIDALWIFHFHLIVSIVTMVAAIWWVYNMRIGRADKILLPIVVGAVGYYGIPLVALTLIAGIAYRKKSQRDVPLLFVFSWLLPLAVFLNLVC